MSSFGSLSYEATRADAFLNLFLYYSFYISRMNLTSFQEAYVQGNKASMCSLPVIYFYFLVIRHAVRHYVRRQVRKQSSYVNWTN